MKLVNRLLVRWSGGWHTVEDSDSIATYGLYEGFLSLGAAQSTSEVDRITSAIFNRQAEPLITTAMGVRPTGDGDTPFDDWDVASIVWAPAEDGGSEQVEVETLALVEDADGRITVAPELRTGAELLEATLERQLSRMANGTLGGSSASASPAEPTGPEPTTPASEGGGSSNAPDVTFNMVEAVAVSPSNVGRHRFHQPVSSLEVIATLDIAGTSDTVVTLYKNGASIGTVTLGNGVTDATATISESFNGSSDYVQARVTSVGSGTPTELVVDVYGS